MGEIIAEGRGNHAGGTTCAMHSQELCLRHMMGFVVRRRGGNIVDSFEEGRELRDKAKKLTSTLMDKKCKKWFHKMVSISEKVWNMKALKLVMPNKTRVGGVYNMFISILRVKPLLDIMFFKAQNDTATKVYWNAILLEEEYQMMAEFKSVLRTMKILSLQAQKVRRNIDCLFCFISFNY